MLSLEQLKTLVLNTLDDMKAQNVITLDVRDRTAMTDLMIIASATSGRHVRAIAEMVAYQAKTSGEIPLGSEGLNEGEWALVDLNSIVLHVMLPKVRDFYSLERLWAAPAPRASLAASA